MNNAAALFILFHFFTFCFFLKCIIDRRKNDNKVAMHNGYQYPKEVSMRLGVFQKDGLTTLNIHSQCRTKILQHSHGYKMIDL